MIKFLILVAALFGIAFGFQWLKRTSGEVALTLGETAYALDLTTAAVALIAIILVTMGLIWFLQELLRAPHRFAVGRRRRNAERGQSAVSQGLIALAAGDLRSAERATAEAARRTPDLPLTRLLQAQTAQLKGDRDAARRIFQDMTADRQTRIAGLRGLYIEAEREGEQQAAFQIASQAREEAPATPWAARALLRHQTASGQWNDALSTLSGAADGRIIDKRSGRRQRAVLLAAQAMSLEDGDPDLARQAALEAHDLAPDLVPAAVVAGRLLSRHGDIRRATRVLEAAWKAGPHPEIIDAYADVRAGDSALDRLRRVETMHRMRPEADEGRLAVARAAIAARDFARAREALTPVLTTRPTQKALLVMADLVEDETGDTGRAREWVARALRAPRDPAWTADGMVLEAWAPASPVTGRIDTVEWKVPVAELEAPRLTIDAEDLVPNQASLPDDRDRPASAGLLPTDGGAAGLSGGGSPDGTPPALDADVPASGPEEPTLQPWYFRRPNDLAGSGRPDPGVERVTDLEADTAPASHEDDRSRSREEDGPTLAVVAAAPPAAPPAAFEEPDEATGAGSARLPPIPDDPGVENEPTEKIRRFGVF